MSVGVVSRHSESMSARIYKRGFFTGPFEKAAVVFDSVTPLIASLSVFVAYQINSG